MSLDLSAAFDTIDHTILLERLKTSFGLSDKCLQWIKSYLSDRLQLVRVATSISKPVRLSCGVPQGSVLGPILFTIYTSPVAHISRIHSVCQQQYADDTQLYISLTNDSTFPLNRLESCLTDLNSWFLSNGLALNPSKSEAILFGSRQRLAAVSHTDTINVAGTPLTFSNHIKILGVVLDNELKFDNHVTAVSKSCNYHIRALRYIRPALTFDAARTVACSLVGSRLDYANSVLNGVSQKNISRLQRVQNTLARVVINAGSQHSSLSALYNLHWLPVKQRIHYKCAVLTFKTRIKQGPHYLSNLLSDYQPARPLRSSSLNLLSTPRTRTVIGGRGFRVFAPTVWNNLPSDFRSMATLATFKTKLKTLLFTAAFEH